MRQWQDPGQSSLTEKMSETRQAQQLAGWLPRVGVVLPGEQPTDCTAARNREPGPGSCRRPWREAVSLACSDPDPECGTAGLAEGSDEK